LTVQQDHHADDVLGDDDGVNAPRIRDDDGAIDELRKYEVSHTSG
jgi:hypothetical protein